jgi:hypothetical protein
LWFRPTSELIESYRRRASFRLAQFYGKARVEQGKQVAHSKLGVPPGLCPNRVAECLPNLSLDRSESNAVDPEVDMATRKGG